MKLPIELVILRQQHWELVESDSETITTVRVLTTNGQVVCVAMPRPAEARKTLPVLYTKNFQHAIDPGFVTYCEPRDLVSVVSEKEEVVVYRINGQIAFTIKRRTGDEAAVTAVRWRSDGTCLAVGWSDGTYGIYSGENGRILSQSSAKAARPKGSLAAVPNTTWRLDLVTDPVNEDDEDEACVAVQCFGWSSYIIDNALLQPRKERFSLKANDWQLLEGEAESEIPSLTSVGRRERSVLAELTREIVTLDVTKSLPRLSAFPGHGLRAGAEGSKFLSQTTTDNVFDSSKNGASQTVECLLVCGSDQWTQVLMNETVQIGSCSLRGEAVMHAANGRCSTQCVLSRDNDSGLWADLLDLPFDKLGGSLLHVMTTNTKRMQDLLAYITHTIRCIQHDFTTGLQFPARLLNNMNLELAEKEEDDVVLQLYHLAMTGEFTPTMLEWLVDVVKDTNHKRWDQSINGMYTNIQNHIFINLLPALDRLSIATTTLRGHARFHEDSTVFDVAPELFTKMLDGIDSLRLVAQKLQLIIMRELRQFQSFSRWLRVMVDIGIAGPGGKTATETEEREVVNFDYVLLRGYITDTMMQTNIRRFIEARQGMTGSCSQEDFFAHPLINQINYERIRLAVKAMNDRGELPAKPQDPAWKEITDVDALFSLPTLTTYLNGSAKIAIESIASWQSRMLRAPVSVQVPASADERVLDMSVHSDPVDRSQAVIQILTQPADNAQTLLCHAIHSSQVPFTTPYTLDRPELEILSAVQSGLETCIALVVDQSVGKYSLLLIKLDQSSGEETVSPIVLHDFHAIEGSSFTPEHILVGGRVGKRVCVVLGNQKRAWIILDLDAKPNLFREHAEDISKVDDSQVSKEDHNMSGTW